MIAAVPSAMTAPPTTAPPRTARAPREAPPTPIVPLSVATTAMGGRLIVHLAATAKATTADGVTAEGTTADAATADEARARRDARRLLSRIGRWADRLSRHLETSELSALNADPRPSVTCRPDAGSRPVGRAGGGGRERGPRRHHPAGRPPGRRDGALRGSDQPLGPGPGRSRPPRVERSWYTVGPGFASTSAASPRAGSPIAALRCSPHGRAPWSTPTATSPCAALRGSSGQWPWTIHAPTAPRWRSCTCRRRAPAGPSPGAWRRRDVGPPVGPRRQPAPPPDRPAHGRSCRHRRRAGYRGLRLRPARRGAGEGGRHRGYPGWPGSPRTSRGARSGPPHAGWRDAGPAPDAGPAGRVRDLP